MTIIPLTIGLLLGDRKSRFSEVEKFLSRDRDPDSRLLSLVNIPITAGFPLVMSPLPRYYRIYSTSYRGIPVRAVPIPVITAVISQKLSPLPRFSHGFTAVISPLQLSNTKFEVSSCSRYRDISKGVEIQNVSCDPDHAHLGKVSHQKANTSRGQLVYKI